MTRTETCRHLGIDSYKILQLLSYANPAPEPNSLTEDRRKKLVGTSINLSF